MRQRAAYPLVGRSSTAGSRSAANTSGAARASSTSSTPRRSSALQHATRTRQYEIFKDYTRAVDEQAERLLPPCAGLFEFAATDREPVDVDEVEPISEIVKRFSTGAMSYGSISAGGPRDPRRSR